METEQKKWFVALLVILAFGWALTGCSASFHVGVSTKAFYPDTWQTGGDVRKGVYVSGYRESPDVKYEGGGS